MIEMCGVSKSFGRVRVVSNVSFEVERSMALALIGPSGSGKTTVLRLIAGFEEPDEGEVKIDGHIVSRPGEVSPPYARGIGMVFQRPALWPHMTVTQNIAFGLAHCKHAEAKARIKGIIELVKLQGLENRYPHQLSGGEAQRVALARALAPRPRILLLDEPFSNLDPELCSNMVALVRQVRSETGITSILVSHDTFAAVTASTSVLVMRGGQVVHAGMGDGFGMPPTSELALMPRTNTDQVAIR